MRRGRCLCYFFVVLFQLVAGWVAVVPCVRIQPVLLYGKGMLGDELCFYMACCDWMLYIYSILPCSTCFI